MIKGDYIEYEFDLYSIKNEDVIENFKKIFGSIISKKGLHYEIYEIDSEKMTGGSASTFPYNKFEETADILLGKKNEISNNSKSLYESLFSDFKCTLENDNPEKLLKQTETEKGYFEQPINMVKNYLKIEEQPEEKTEEQTEEQPEEKTEEQPEEKTEEKTEEQPEEKTEEQPEEKTEEQPEEKTEEQPEEKTEEKIDEQPEEKTEEQTEEQTEEKTEEQTEEKIDEQDVLKTIIRVKLIIQHMKKIIELEDIKKGKNL